MAPKRAKSSSASTASIARAVGRGAKATSSGDAALRHKKGVRGQPVAKGKEQSSSAPSSHTPEQLFLAQGRPELNADSAQYNMLWDSVKRKMGMPKNAPIHSQHMNRIDHILRVFDLDPAYGPCLGMSRLERWERAERLGDEPPLEIKQILETRQGVLELDKSVLADKGV